MLSMCLRAAMGPVRRLGLVVLIAALFSLGSVAAVRAQSANFSSKAPNAILMDAASGSILWQREADELVAPASMSKLMTVAVVFKALKDKKLRLEDEFVMSVNAWRTGGAPSGTSAMMVPVNTRVSLGELLQGIIIQSGNDAAIAVAEGIAGSEAAFARMMEAEARRIGLKQSTFRNATGLPHPEHRMSVRELAMLARHLIREYPEYYAYFGQKIFNYRKHKFINRNPLVFSSIGVDGLKTGHLKEAGYGMVTSALQDGRRLIAVVSGLPTANDRKSESQKLIEYGFSSFAAFKVFDAGEVIGRARVWGGSSMFVPLIGSGDVTILLPRFPASQRLKGEIVYMGPLKPPIQRGEVVAHLRVTSTSNAVAEVPLQAAEDVERAGVVRRGLDTIVQIALGWALL